MTQTKVLVDLIERVSPYTGKGRAMHKWMALNATEEGFITPDRVALARAVGAHVQYVTHWLWSAVEDGYLEVVVNRKDTKVMSTFRVLDPRLAIQGLAG